MMKSAVEADTAESSAKQTAETGTEQHDGGAPNKGKVAGDSDGDGNGDG
jgi:hypothetical protein